MSNAQLDSAEPIPPAAPPRELTRLVRRRAWSERHVRAWWLLAGAMLIIAGYYVISRVYAWSDETRLTTNGEKVMAEVYAGGGNLAPKGQPRPLPADTVVDMEFKFKDQTYQVRGALAGRTEVIMTRTPIPIFIDPKNPMHWTGRTVPAELAHELFAAMLLVPIIAFLFAFALLTRRRVLRTYREGESVLAEVINVSHSATAPLSRTIGVAAHLGGFDRVIKILLPTNKSPAVGETLWLLAIPGQLEQAIPLALFE